MSISLVFSDILRLSRFSILLEIAYFRPNFDVLGLIEVKFEKYIPQTAHHYVIPRLSAIVRHNPSKDLIFTRAGEKICKKWTSQTKRYISPVCREILQEWILNKFGVWGRSADLTNFAIFLPIDLRASIP